VISEDEHPSTVPRYSCANDGVEHGYQVRGSLDQAFILIRLCCMHEMNEILTTAIIEMATKIIYNITVSPLDVLRFP